MRKIKRGHQVERRILFIDDDAMVLQGLKRTLRPFREDWDMVFVESGKTALDLLHDEPFDVVVTDLRMPAMDGVTLLEKIMEQYPQIVRIVLSGESDMGWIMRSARVSHQFLTKPCEPEVLKLAILKTCMLFDLLQDKAVIQLVSKIETLPSLPTLYEKIMEMLNSPDASIKDVGDIIAKDTAMTAKILQLVNSAFFGLPRHVSSPGQAAALLGMDTVKSLVLTIQIFSQFDLNKMPSSFLEELWRHNITTGQLSKKISEEEKLERVAIDHAFMGGLLHDTGKLILASNFSDAYRNALSLSRKAKIPIWESEKKIFGITHAEVGAYLMGLWGLPVPIVEALAFHHAPSLSLEENFTPLTAVHLANVMEHEGPSGNGKGGFSSIDEDYLNRLEAVDRLQVWRTLCRNCIQRGEIDDA
jgi:HD-like signal output (HDOD) protein